jgi:UDP-GlcNAc:undecaprenyl-phosphate GlcNAc-1-phosphate transferase
VVGVAVSLASPAAFVIGLVVTAILTPLVIRLSHHYRLYDPVDARKQHGNRMPRLGGVAMFVGLVAAMLAGLVLFGHYRLGKAVLVSSAFAPVFLVSLYDDLRSLPWWVRLLVQTAAAAVFAAAVDPVVRLNLPLIGTVGLGIWSYPLTVLWLLLVTNAMNLIDGLDGLAAGVGAVSAAVLFVSSIRTGYVIPAILAAAIAGVCLGFLPFNFPPARIFMGDSGAMVIGFALGAASMTGAGKNVAFISLLVPILALAIPISDVIGAVVRRSARGRNIFAADREHLHHYLLALGLGPTRTVLLLYVATALLGVVGLYLSAGSRIPAVALLLLGGAGMLLVFRRRRVD